MGFLDDLGRTFTDTSREIAQTTKNYADVAKLNTQIAGEEKAMSGVYEKLGRAWYEAHKDDEEPEFAEYSAQLRTSLEKIEGWKGQINAIKGVQVCPSCGKVLPEAAAFCSECGTKLEKKPAPAPDPEDPTVCQSCGAKLPEAARFCTHCGTPVPVREEPAEECACEEEKPCCCECETPAEEAAACVEAAGEAACGCAEKAGETLEEAICGCAEKAEEAAAEACGCAEKAAEAVEEAVTEAAETAE